LWSMRVQMVGSLMEAVRIEEKARTGIGGRDEQKGPRLARPIDRVAAM
jgi:hypothetical protein